MIQKTLVLIKPDGLKRGLTGEIIKRVEQAGMKIVAMKMVHAEKGLAELHYSDAGIRYGARVLDNLTSYLTEGPVIAVCFEGVEAISNVRRLVGSTYPNESAPGTIRGDFCHTSKNHANENNRKVGNLIHASEDEKDAKREIELWFSGNEIHDYKRADEEQVW